MVATGAGGDGGHGSAAVQGREGKGAVAAEAAAVARAWLLASCFGWVVDAGARRFRPLPFTGLGAHGEKHGPRSRCRSGRWHARGSSRLTSWIAAFDATPRRTERHGGEPTTPLPTAPGVRSGAGALEFLACNWGFAGLHRTRPRDLVLREEECRATCQRILTSSVWSHGPWQEQ